MFKKSQCFNLLFIKVYPDPTKFDPTKLRIQVAVGCGRAYPTECFGYHKQRSMAKFENTRDTASAE
jgi:hypothetical protein